MKGKGGKTTSNRELGDPTLGNTPLCEKPLPQGVMNGGWHSLRSQKVQIQVLLTLQSWESPFPC